MCVANSDNHRGSCCKTTEKFQSAAPVSGLPGVALYPSLVYFWDLLSISECSHDMWWGVGWRAMSVSGVKSLFYKFGDVWSKPRVAHGRFGWRSGMKTARQIYAKLRSSKGNSSPHIQRFECTQLCRNLCCCGFLNFSFGSEEHLCLEEKNVLDWSLAALFRACLAFVQDWRVELRLCAWMFGPYRSF